MTTYKSQKSKSNLKHSILPDILILSDQINKTKKIIIIWYKYKTLQWKPHKSAASSGLSDYLSNCQRLNRQTVFLSSRTGPTGPNVAGYLTSSSMRTAMPSAPPPVLDHDQEDSWGFFFSVLDYQRNCTWNEEHQSSTIVRSLIYIYIYTHFQNGILRLY